MGTCREARWLPGAPWYFVEWGDGVEDWEKVRERATSVVRLQAVDRNPWTGVYHVAFGDEHRAYLVDEKHPPPEEMLDAMAGFGDVAAAWYAEGLPTKTQMPPWWHYVAEIP